MATHSIKDGGDVVLRIGWKDAMRLRGGATLEVHTEHGNIGIRHADRSDGGITTPHVWPDKDEVPYDRCLTVTERTVKRLESGDLREDWWREIDTFPHRVYMQYV